ncbi:MAG TPA: CBS domain-containing protein, partial [Bacillota bacterium]|nr:CBS domain-containing protein [Bacillota bacterium]
FDYLTIYKNKTVDKTMTIADIMEVLDLDSDPRQYFVFIDRKLTVEDAYDHFDKNLKQRRELLLLLVTEHGERNEKLLGIVTLRDIENALIN